MANVAEWNFFKQNVQSGLLEGRYLSAKHTMIAAGPPFLAAAGAGSEPESELGADLAYPMGLIQAMGITQNPSLMRLFEIGSERSYYMRGHTVGQITLSGVMYHGPSLLRKLYAYLDDGLGPSPDNLYANNARAYLNTSGADLSKREFVLPAGYANFWINVASDIFAQPVGLLFYFRDSNNDTYGAVYAEYCNVANHGIGTDSQGTMLSENVVLAYERLVPIDIQAVPLLPDKTPIVGSIVTEAVGVAV